MGIGGEVKMVMDEQKEIKKDIYLNYLEVLKLEAESIANTHMMLFGKVLALVMLNMRYEHIMIDRNLDTHPYLLVKEFIKDTVSFLKAWKETGFIENKTKGFSKRDNFTMEKGHQELFQKIWKKYSKEEYEEYIERYVKRLLVNGLDDGWLKGFKCIDFGCGNGNFAHALIRKGADYVYGIDFGAESINYAVNARDEIGISPDRIEFKVETVYNVSKQDNSFDFAIQNGVFHHLEDEEKAIEEVRRVLKPGGWFWYYTAGLGSISRDLWAASVYILRNISQEDVLSCLDSLNITAGKRCFLADALNAVYRLTTWDEVVGRLARLGFGNFRRLVGGFDTDFDHDVIEKDKFGREKFGEGDIRLLAQKL